MLLFERDAVAQYGQVAGYVKTIVNGVTKSQPFLLTPIVRQW